MTDEEKVDPATIWTLASHRACHCILQGGTDRATAEGARGKDREDI